MSDQVAIANQVQQTRNEERGRRKILEAARANMAETQIGSLFLCFLFDLGPKRLQGVGRTRSRDVGEVEMKSEPAL